MTERAPDEIFPDEVVLLRNQIKYEGAEDVVLGLNTQGYAVESGCYKNKERVLPEEEIHVTDQCRYEAVLSSLGGDKLRIKVTTLDQVTHGELGSAIRTQINRARANRTLTYPARIYSREDSHFIILEQGPSIHGVSNAPSDVYVYVVSFEPREGLIDAREHDRLMEAFIGATEYALQDHAGKSLDIGYLRKMFAQEVSARVRKAG